MGMRNDNAEKQARWRERHLGEGGDLVRLQCYVTVRGRKGIDRLMRVWGCGLNELIDRLVKLGEGRL